MIEMILRYFDSALMAVVVLDYRLNYELKSELVLKTIVKIKQELT